MMRFLAVCAAILLGLTACSDAPTQQARILGTSTSDAAQVARLISEYRVARGLTPVTVNATLNRAAVFQAEAVAKMGRLSHGNFSARMHEFQIRGAAAENLSAGSNAAAAVVERWKKSPGHNENLLMPEARQVGFARVTTASGYRTYWALVLAAPQGDRNFTGME